MSSRFVAFVLIITWSGALPLAQRMIRLCVPISCFGVKRLDATVILSDTSSFELSSFAQPYSSMRFMCHVLGLCGQFYLVVPFMRSE